MVSYAFFTDVTCGDPGVSIAHCRSAMVATKASGYHAPGISADTQPCCGSPDRKYSKCSASPFGKLIFLPNVALIAPLSPYHFTNDSWCLRSDMRPVGKEWVIKFKSRC